MSEAYRRLCQDLPPAVGGAVRFPAEPRKVRAWVEGLPRANAQAVEQEVARALEGLAGQRLEGGQRFAALEELRAVVLETIALLEAGFAGSPLPLPPDRERAAGLAIRFHQQLAIGYRQAVCELCAPNGSVPFLRGGSVLAALERAAWHSVRTLAMAWRVYRPAPEGLWQGLHRLHRYSVALKLDRKSVEDKAAGGSHDVHTLYLQALLMASVNPYAFAQAEQDALWPATRGYAARCGLLKRAPEGIESVVPEDADRGPGAPVTEESPATWLELAPFADDVDRALERVRDGQGLLAPTPGLSVPVGNDLLIRLRRAFGQMAARGLVRLPAGHSLDTVLGLSGLHYLLAGQRDFDTFMRQSAQGTVHVIAGAAWTQGSAAMTRVPRFTAKVLDQSLGGYRMAWDSAEQARARVGELVGLGFGQDGEELDWMVGVMRWLRYETDGSLSAGVELLSRRSSPVALRIASPDGGHQQVQRAVEVFPIDGTPGRCFVCSGTVEAGSRLEVIHDAASHIPEVGARGPDLVASVEVLLNAGDYILLGERLPDAAPAAPTAEEATA